MCVFQVLRDLFSYKPLLTKQQFLQFGFAERKISLLCDIIGFVLEKHKQLTKGTKVWIVLHAASVSNVKKKSTGQRSFTKLARSQFINKTKVSTPFYRVFISQMKL